MALMPFFSSVPLPWRAAAGVAAICAVGGAFGLGVWQGYAAGREAGAARGSAALAALREEYAANHAKALAALNEKLRAQTRITLETGERLAREKESHAHTHTTLRRQIASATRGSVHRFSPDFVRLFNQATGAVPAAGDIRPAGSGGAAAPAASAASPGAGLLRTGSKKYPAKAVSEADVLAYILYYGARCRDMESQVRGLVTIMEETR